MCSYDMEVVRVSRKYQVVIPKEVRRELNICEGDELIVSVENNRIVMRLKPRSYTDYTRGLYKEIWRGVDAAEYVERERRSWE